MRDFTVCIPTRGTPVLAVALAGLVHHAAAEPFPIHIVTVRQPTDTATKQLLNTLFHLGCAVRITLSPAGRLGLARWQCADVDTEYLVSLDDDEIVTPAGAFDKMVSALRRFAWSAPIMRCSSEFDEPVSGHVEVWERVRPDDERVRQAIARRGADWARVYDTGRNFAPSSLNGSAFACRADALRSATADMGDWHLGGEDFYIGTALGEGVTLAGIYGYHAGEFSPRDWQEHEVGYELRRADPDAYRETVLAVSRRQRARGTLGGMT